jgi:superfamily II DNA/RNA helicase
LVKVGDDAHSPRFTILEPTRTLCRQTGDHGAKFASAIGEKLARLAVDPAYQFEPFFQLSRYSAFA